MKKCKHITCWTDYPFVELGDTAGEREAITVSMTDIKVLYVVAMTEHERGWGSRHDGYLAFLSEASADKHLAEMHAARGNVVPDEYTEYTKIGYRETCAARIKAIKADPDRDYAYVDRVNELLTPKV
jgi:hypothetical protein